MDDISQLVDSARAYRIQETPYFKRLRMREESDLRHLREAQEIVQQSAKDFLELQLRRIRLNKLYNDIHQNIEKGTINSKGQQKIQKVFSTFDEIRKSRISMSRRRGNEFSRQNRNNLDIIPKDDTKILNKKYDNVFIKRKVYGQQVSKFNLRKLQKLKQLTNNINEDISGLKRNKKEDYGTYYTLRNRLNYKDTLGEYDNEYTELLMKCVSFEKEHLDVCGFLEEKLKTNYGDINKIISKVTKSDNLIKHDISSVTITTQPEIESVSDIRSSIHIYNDNSLTHTSTSSQFTCDTNYNQVSGIDMNIPEVIDNNSELFVSDNVLQNNRYLNSVEEENENNSDDNDNDNQLNDDDNITLNRNNINDVSNTIIKNNINKSNSNTIIDSETKNISSLPTIYQSQHSIHNNMQDTRLKNNNNLNVNTDSIDNINLDEENETYHENSTKSSEFGESVSSSNNNTSCNEITDSIDNKNVYNEFVDYDNDTISDKSRKFEEELESLRYTEEDIENISTYVIKNNFVLEDVISDMIENSRIDGTPLNFYKLLSNIYLAYGMNLIKSSIDDKHIDLNVIKSAAEKQNASMSHALHVIFSSR